MPTSRRQFLAGSLAAAGASLLPRRNFNAAGADPDGEIGEAHHPETHLIPLVLDVAAGRMSNIKVFGDDYETADGTCIRDYVHVSDLATAHVAALRHLLDGSKSFAANLGTGTGWSVRQVIDAAERVTGRAIPVEVAPRRPGDSPALVADPAAAQRLFGWTPARAASGCATWAVAPPTATPRSATSITPNPKTAADPPPPATGAAPANTATTSRKHRAGTSPPVRKTVPTHPNSPHPPGPGPTPPHHPPPDHRR